MRNDGIEMNGILALKTGANIASAATTDLATATGNSVTITGTTTITALGTVQSGAVFTLTFSGILILTHNGTSLILPTGANITTAAGDVMQVVSLGSGNWKCTNYLRASGAPLVGAASSLAATLAVGNTTGGTDIEMTTTDKIVFDNATIEDTGVLTITGGVFIDVDVAGDTSTVSIGTKVEIQINDTTNSHTESFIIGQPDGSAGFLLATSDGVDTQTITLKPDGFTAPLNYQPSQSFTQPYEIVNKEYVDGRPAPAYTTISLASWTTLVGANGLVAGTFYRVTSAYTFDFYGAKDIIVIANSANTIQTTTYVVFGDILVPYTNEADLSNPGFFLDCVQQMALDPDTVLDYISGTNWKFNAALTMLIVATDGFYYEAQVQGTDPSTLVLNNVKALDGPNVGLFGTYVPETAPAAADDFFLPNASERIVRMEITDAEIDAGTAINITGLPEVVGYFWSITNAAIQYTGTTPYTNIMYVGIISKDPQYDDAGRLVTGTDSFGGMADIRSDTGGGNGDCYAAGRCQVTFSGTGGGGGDGVAVLFLTAQLVKIAA